MLTTIFIFLIILTIYLHVAYHLKTSNESDIYETVFLSKEQLDKVCKLRQPFIFNYIEFPSFERKQLVNKYGNYDIIMKSVGTGESVPFKLTEAIQLIDRDTTGSYYIEKNGDFINSNLKERIGKYEKDIRPIFTGKCMYDMLLGSHGSYTQLKQEINYRNFFLVTEGSVKIRFAPPKSEEYLDASVDYETLEITSQIQVWNNETKIQNVEFIDIVASKGQMIHIPPYWWYSIQFVDCASIVSFKYRTYMNTITLMPQLFMQLLQLQNIQPIIGICSSLSPYVIKDTQNTEKKHKPNKLKIKTKMKKINKKNTKNVELHSETE